MHWVNRGPEPDGVGQVRDRYTQGWVQHYRHGVGRRPSDTRWRDFHNDLERAFHGLCAYCEEICKGEVDHFRPKSRYPELVYAWSNWLFACHDCNQAKSGRWPAGGYVDPCANFGPAHPEHYFDFDVLTGEILPQRGLSQGRRDRAQKTITNLRLNWRHHLKKRLEWLLLLSSYISEDPSDETSDMKSIRDHLASRGTQLSSITRAWLSQRGYPTDD